MQDRTAHTVSEWLARDVFLPLRPSSILEIGCGSGRNLVYVGKYLPETEIMGIDINPKAVETANTELRGARASVRVGSVYELTEFADKSVDVVFSSGVLMHVPHDRVKGVVTEMHRIARRAVIHFELHGPAHHFDYHRYPRDYEQLYRELNLATIRVVYEVYPRPDFRGEGTSSFNLALLTSIKVT